MNVSPRKGLYMRAHYKGRTYEGKVHHIARMRSGAVLAFLQDSDGVVSKKGIPVSKYATWEIVRKV